MPLVEQPEGDPRRQRLVAVGWVRLRAGSYGDRETWEYSGLAERTLRAYRANFPSLFSLLEMRPKDDDYPLLDAFPPSVDESGWGPAAAVQGGGGPAKPSGPVAREGRFCPRR